MLQNFGNFVSTKGSLQLLQPIKQKANITAVIFKTIFSLIPKTLGTVFLQYS